MTISKVDIAHAWIRRAFRDHPVDRCAVACSFGKDSEAVLHLVLQHEPNIKVIFCNTGIEFPETLAFRDLIVKKWNLNYHEAKSKDWSFVKIVKEYGLPKVRGKQNNSTPKCCQLLKDDPAFEMYHDLGIDCIFWGLTAAESRNRKLLSLRPFYDEDGQPILGDDGSPCLGNYYRSHQQKLWKVAPIMDWTPEDVWQYIHENDLPYNAFYDRCPGDRVGCAPCTAYNSWQKKMPYQSPKWFAWVRKQRSQTVLEDHGKE